jgi:hypothetical protein
MHHLWILLIIMNLNMCRSQSIGRRTFYIANDLDILRNRHKQFTKFLWLLLNILQALRSLIFSHIKCPPLRHVFSYIYISTWDNISMYITYLHRNHLHSLLPTYLWYFGTYPSMYKVVYLDLHGQGGNSRVYKVDLSCGSSTTKS